MTKSVSYFLFFKSFALRRQKCNFFFRRSRQSRQSGVKDRHRADDQTRGIQFSGATTSCALFYSPRTPFPIGHNTIESTISIVRGLKSRYEVHHGYGISDQALVTGLSSLSSSVIVRHNYRPRWTKRPPLRVLLRSLSLPRWMLWIGILSRCRSSWRA